MALLLKPILKEYIPLTSPFSPLVLSFLILAELKIFRQIFFLLWKKFILRKNLEVVKIFGNVLMGKILKKFPLF